jgi:hypothetical protein
MYIHYTEEDSPLLSQYKTAQEKIPYMIEELTFLARQAKLLATESCSNAQIIFCVEMGQIWGDLANQIVCKLNYLDIYQIDLMSEDDPFLKGICGPGLYNIALKYKPDFEQDLLKNLPQDRVLLLIFSRGNIETFWIPTTEKSKLN